MMAKFGLTTEDASFIAHLANGNYLKATEAISVNEENKYYLEQFIQMMRKSWQRDVRGLKNIADSLASIGRERQKNFLIYCQHLIRENFIYRFQLPEINYLNLEEAAFSRNFSPYVNERNVFEIVDELSKGERDIAQNVNPKMVFFDIAIKLTRLVRQ